jgi:hypothetical protein
LHVSADSYGPLLGYLVLDLLLRGGEGVVLGKILAHTHPPPPMPIGRPLLVGPAFLAFIWRRGLRFLNPLPRPFNFFADFLGIAIMLPSLGIVRPRLRGG